MNKFVQRLKYYGLGFGIGLVFVFMFFQNRGCSWLPSNRVKNSILDRVLVIPDAEMKVLKEKGIGKDEIIELLNTGDVDFEKSKKDGDFKVYYLSKGAIKLFFTLPHENFISEVKYPSTSAGKVKNTAEGFGKMLSFPNDKDLVYVDSSEVLSCQLDVLGFVDERLILKSMKSNGRIDFSKTYFYKTPKPVVYITYPDKQGKEIGSKAIWYKNKITVKSFDIPYKTKCE